MNRISNTLVSIATVWLLLVLVPYAVFASERPSKLTEDKRNTIQLFKQASRGVVHISARTTMSAPFEKHTMENSTGTGSVIDGEGRILTAFHVIKDKNEITVVLGSWQFTARLLCSAPQFDIALLRVEAQKDELFPLPLGTSQDLEVSPKVIAIGNAVGLHNSERNQEQQAGQRA